MELKVAFYRGKGGMVHKVVRWWTKSNYSHAELILPDGVTWVGISPFKTSRLEARISPDFKESDWEFINISVNETQNDIIKEFYDSTEGCKYDWSGMILSQILPYHIKRKNKWYCSEWIAYALRISGVLDWRLIKIYDRSDLSPAALYDILGALKENEV